LGSGEHYREDCLTAGQFLLRLQTTTRVGNGVRAVSAKGLRTFGILFSILCERFCSEEELHGHLHRSRAADLVQRIESAAAAARSRRCSQHLRRLPELRRSEVVDGASEIRMVEDIEEVGARLQCEALAQFETAGEV
jgi:hypothetical protein